MAGKIALTALLAKAPAPARQATPKRTTQRKSAVSEVNRAIARAHATAQAKVHARTQAKAPVKSQAQTKAQKQRALKAKLEAYATASMQALGEAEAQAQGQKKTSAAWRAVFALQAENEALLDWIERLEQARSDAEDEVDTHRRNAETAQEERDKAVARLEAAMEPISDYLDHIQNGRRSDPLFDDIARVHRDQVERALFW